MRQLNPDYLPRLSDNTKMRSHEPSHALMLVRPPKEGGQNERWSVLVMGTERQCHHAWARARNLGEKGRLILRAVTREEVRSLLSHFEQRKRRKLAKQVKTKIRKWRLGILSSSEITMVLDVVRATLAGKPCYGAGPDDDDMVDSPRRLEESDEGTQGQAGN